MTDAEALALYEERIEELNTSADWDNSDLRNIASEVRAAIAAPTLIKAIKELDAWGDPHWVACRLRGVDPDKVCEHCGHEVGWRTGEPGEPGIYLVTTEHGVETAVWDDNPMGWWRQGATAMRDPLAWQPLPAPFQPEEDFDG